MKPFLCGGVFLLAAAVSMPGAAITDLFNTGVDAAGVGLAVTNGATDIHYTVISSPSNTGTPHSAVTYYNLAYSPADNASSDWISVNTSGSDGSGGSYDYQTTFTIGALYDPSTALITGQFEGDDHIIATRINGVVVSGATADSFQHYTPFSITSGFVAGLNTLDFIVLDDGQPTALRVDSLVGTVSPLSTPTVPEPASLLLIGGSIVFLASYRLFRRNTQAF